MDGGGRVAGSLTVGFPDEAAARAASARPVIARLARLAAFGGRRRGSVAAPSRRRLPRGTGVGLVLAFYAAVYGVGVAQNGDFARFRDSHGDPRDILARALGLGVDKVTIAGLSVLSERDVLTTGGITPASSLPFLGAAALRERLEAAPMVRRAEIRKSYPNELAITLVEREPFALWQRNGELSVVAADGAVIDRLRDPALAGLPLVVGDGANLRAADYAALLAAAGPLRSKIRAGMLVSGRRWTLKMENGLDVRLPEEGAAAAVARLVRLDRDAGLLDRDVLAIDLRMPDRVVVRLSEEAVAARLEGVKKKPGRGAKGVET